MPEVFWLKKLAYFAKIAALLQTRYLTVSLLAPFLLECCPPSSIIREYRTLVVRLTFGTVS